MQLVLPQFSFWFFVLDGLVGVLAKVAVVPVVVVVVPAVVHVVTRAPSFSFPRSVDRYPPLRCLAGPAARLATYRTSPVREAGQVSPGDLSDQPRAGGWSGLAVSDLSDQPCLVRLVRSRSWWSFGPMHWYRVWFSLLRGFVCLPKPLLGSTVAAVHSRCLI